MFRYDSQFRGSHGRLINPSSRCRLILSVILFLACFAFSLVSRADCIADITGEIFCGAGKCMTDQSGAAFCSRHDRGDIILTMRGEVLCGRGQCGKDTAGRIFCSSEIGGAVMRDRSGNVRCTGQCIPGSVSDCATVKASSSTK